MKFLAPLCALILATPAYAQEFSVLLGGKTLGQLSFSQKGSTATLRSTLDQTPMGVFNGTFVGTSEGAARNATFTGDSQSSRKQRRVIVKYKNGRAHNVDITPAQEQTKHSDPERVSASVMDPVRIIAALMDAEGCPSAMLLYDGRREVRISPNGQDQTAQMLTCRMSYKVTKGPGHLSPLGISSAKMQMTYDNAGGVQKLQQIKISSGVFRLNLDRRN